MSAFIAHPYLSFVVLVGMFNHVNVNTLIVSSKSKRNKLFESQKKRRHQPQWAPPLRFSAVRGEISTPGSSSALSSLSERLWSLDCVGLCQQEVHVRRVNPELCLSFKATAKRRGRGRGSGQRLWQPCPPLLSVSGSESAIVAQSHFRLRFSESEWERGKHIYNDNNNNSRLELEQNQAGFY